MQLTLHTALAAALLCVPAACNQVSAVEESAPVSGAANLEEASTQTSQTPSPETPSTQTSNPEPAMPAATQTEFWPNTKPLSFPKPKPIRHAKPKNLVDAKQTLDALQDFLRKNEPRYIQTLTPETAIEKAKAVALYRVQIESDLKWMKAIEVDSLGDPKSPEGQMLANALKPAIEYLESRLPRSIDQVAKHTTDSLVGAVNSHWWFIQKAATVDMSNESQVRQFLGNEMTNRSRDAAIQSAIQLVDAALTVESILGEDLGWKAKKKELRGLIKEYTKKLAKAADAVMPPADVNDKELTRIAKDVLGRKKYGLPKFERLIVNTKKKSGQVNEHWIDFSERTITECPKRWEEFQCATIEKDGDGYALWYNTLIYYHEGPHTVPTGKWVLSSRHKSAPISKANITR